MANVTLQLESPRPDGPRPTSAELLPLVYDELRKLAAARLAQENPGQTLQATALVHEAYLRLGGGQADSTWQSRAHFFGAAAEAMRRILIDAARRKGRQKRGGDQHRIDFSLVEPAVEGSNFDLLALNDALTEFSGHDPIKAELVKLRYFAGLTLDEEIVRGLSEGEPKTVLAKRLARSFSLGRAEVYDRVVELSSTE